MGKCYVISNTNMYAGEIDEVADGVKYTTNPPLEDKEDNYILWDDVTEKWFYQPYPDAWAGCSVTEEEFKNQNLVDSYNQYLRETDWIKGYLLEHRLGIEIIPENSSKWLIINTRQSYIDFLKGL